MAPESHTRERPEAAYLHAFEKAREELRARSPEWLLPIREGALARFEASGFPTLRNEEWIYTNVAPLTRAPFAPSPRAPREVTPADVERFTIPGLSGPRLVFVDGRFAAGLSELGTLPEGVQLESLAAALAREPALEGWFEEDATPAPTGGKADSAAAFWNLNTAFFDDGVHLRLSPGTVLADPIQVVHLMTGEGREASFPRNLLRAEEGSRATLIEVYASTGGGNTLTDAFTEVFVGAGAHLRHFKIQREHPAAYHLAAQRARQAEDSHYGTCFFSFGGALVRNEITLTLAGEGGDSDMHGLYVVDGDRHVDNHTVIHHLAPHCHSREVYKGVVGDQARGIFSGKIHVHPGAQKTDAKQSNDGLLLSPDATVNTRPRLEIYADDVRCTHGATVGELDADGLFYLRSRGLPERDARLLLTRAFASAVIEEIECEPLRAAIETLFRERLPDITVGESAVGESAQTTGDR